MINSQIINTKIGGKTYLYILGLSDLADIDIKFDETDLIQYKMSLRNVIKTSAASNSYFSVNK